MSHAMPKYLSSSMPVVMLGILLGSCQAQPEGLWPTPAGTGPLVRFDLDAKPLPEIPFPNDLATRPDPSAATGRRVNASLVAPTWMEVDIREKIDRLDGFGTFQPITVAFDRPLDIDDLVSRHRGNLSFSDDSVFLVDLDPESPEFDQPVFLDLGRGNFPLTLKNRDNFFPSDPRAEASNLLFDTTEEDLNRNQVLDPGEDTDDDGVLDRPNVWPEGTDPLDGLMTFYELETNTLILRPVVPLRERTSYAVVLTDRLRGGDGQPVRSPFPWVHHLEQTEELGRLEEVFDRWRRQGIQLSLENVAFAWVFTTQTISADLVAIREGLYGVGPLGWLEREFPPEATPHLAKDQGEERRYLLEGARLKSVLETLGQALMGSFMKLAAPIIDSMDQVDYFASGWFESPDFIDTQPDGLDPRSIHREHFALDPGTGRARVKPGQIHFFLSVPKETEQHRPPFPVVVYCHGHTSFRAELLAFAGFLARYGMATVGIDAWGHGLNVGDAETEELIRLAASSFGFEPTIDALLKGRARDLDGDGQVDSGGDFWTAYGFHNRDGVRQSLVDLFQLVRVLRAFDGERRWELDQDGDGRGDLAGDFDGDGRVDAGGPQVRFYATGQSLGGILSALLGPLEPAVVATAPIAGGGGLGDIGMRSMLGSVRRAVILRSLGPLIIGEPAPQGALRISLLVPISNGERSLPLGEVPGVLPGDRVVVENLERREEVRATIREGPRFRVSMPADVDDRFAVAFYGKDGSLIDRLDRFGQDIFYLNSDQPSYRAGDDLRTPAEGLGKVRGTPDFRKLAGLFQMILDPSDPASLARHYFLEPLFIRPEGAVETNLLKVATLGDQDVPINTQATIARAAGLILYLQANDHYGMPVNDWLISRYVYEGLAGVGRYPGADVLFDPDDLDQGLDGYAAPAPDPQDRLRIKRYTKTGISGIRFAYMQPTGQHGVIPLVDDPAFDMFSYFANLVARYFASGGTDILDDPCLATSCDQ